MVFEIPPFRFDVLGILSSQICEEYAERERERGLVGKKFVD